MMDIRFEEAIKKYRRAMVRASDLDGLAFAATTMHDEEPTVASLRLTIRASLITAQADLALLDVIESIYGENADVEIGLRYLTIRHEGSFEEFILDEED